MTLAPAVLPSRHILVVDDDTQLREQVAGYLTEHGFCVHAAADAREMDRALEASPIDLVVLDLMLPGEDGLSICRRLSAEGGPAIIMVSAMGEEIDRVLGLELGADDYVSKPYSARELVARLRAILRRAAFLDQTEKPNQLAFGALSVDLDMHVARVDGHPLDLTRREFELLAYFLQNPRRVLSRERILQQVWGLEYLGESRTIDAHVRRVRAKLGDAANLIETVVGVGYRLGSVEG